MAANFALIVALTVLALSIFVATAEQLDYCFENTDITLTGSNKQSFGWKNTKGCTCEEAVRRHTRPKGFAGHYMPQCDSATKKFAAKQWHGSTGSSWCADPKTGHQISEASYPSNPVELNC